MAVKRPQMEKIMPMPSRCLDCKVYEVCDSVKSSNQCLSNLDLCPVCAVDLVSSDNPDAQYRCNICKREYEKINGKLYCAGLYLYLHDYES